MESILSPFLSFLLLYKYFALFAIAFVAAFALPIPASATLAAAGAFAQQGYLNIFSVISVALAGNIAGDAFGFFLARRYGARILNRVGFKHLLHSQRYQKLKKYIFDFPESLIYFSRFLTETGPAVNLLAGLSNVPPKKYFLFEVLGETSYVLLYGLIGYALGTQWENNISFLTKVLLVILPLGLIINAFQVFLYRRRRRKQ